MNADNNQFFPRRPTLSTDLRRLAEAKRKVSAPEFAVEQARKPFDRKQSFVSVATRVIWSNHPHHGKKQRSASYSRERFFFRQT